MEMDLLKLQQANRISQQQFDINMQKIANEKEQLRITEDNYKRTAQVREAYNTIMSTYYDDMVEAQRSRDTASLISTRADIATEFRGNPILHEDVIRQIAQQQAGGGLSIKQLDKYIEKQGGNTAFMEAAERAFINQLFPGLSGLGGSAAMEMGLTSDISPPSSTGWRLERAIKVAVAVAGAASAAYPSMMVSTFVPTVV